MPDRDTHEDWDLAMEKATAVRVINYKPRQEKHGGRVCLPSSEPVVLSPADTCLAE